MGAAISALRDQILGGDDKAKEDILQQLLFLVNAANGKLDNYQADMEQQFRNREKVSETSIVGMRAMRWERGYRVGVTKQANNGINEIVDAFFGDKKGDNQESPILAGFKKVISTALDVILGNTMAGEQEEIKWFVFAHHNAIIRIDVRLWRYNFIGKGVMAQAENVFCYVFCTSVVDHTALKVDELVYLLSEHGGDEHVEAYLGYLLNIWSKLEAIAKDPTKNPFTTQGLPPRINQMRITAPDEVAVKFVEEAKASKTETLEEKQNRLREERIDRARRRAVEDMENKVQDAVEKAAEEEERKIKEEEEAAEKKKKEDAERKIKEEEEAAEKKKKEDAEKKKREEAAEAKEKGRSQKSDSNKVT